MSYRSLVLASVMLALLALTLPATARQQTLLTREEVEGVLGVPVEVDVRGSNGNSFTSKSPLGSVTIDLTDPAVSAMLRGSHETLPDLGDYAFFQMASAQVVVLHVVHGTTAFILSVAYPLGKPEGVTDLEATAKELAALALADS